MDHVEEWLRRWGGWFAAALALVTHGWRLGNYSASTQRKIDEAVRTAERALIAAEAAEALAMRVDKAMAEHTAAQTEKHLAFERTLERIEEQMKQLSSAAADLLHAAPGLVRAAPALVRAAEVIERWSAEGKLPPLGGV